MRTKMIIALFILGIICIGVFYYINGLKVDNTKSIPEVNKILDYDDKLIGEYITGFISYDSNTIKVELDNKNISAYKAPLGYTISNVFYDRIKKYISFSQEKVSHNQDTTNIVGSLNVWNYKKNNKWVILNYNKNFSTDDEYGGLLRYYNIQNYNPSDTSGICLVNGPEYSNVAFLKHGKFVDHNNKGSDLATTLIAFLKDSIIVEDGYLFIININNDSTKLFNEKNLSSYKNEILKNMGYNADYYIKSLNKYAGYFSNWNNLGTALIYYEKSNLKKKGYLYVPSKNITMKLNYTENEIIPIWKD